MDIDKTINDYKNDDNLDIDMLVNDFTPYIKAIIKNMAGNIITKEDREEILLDVFFIIWKNQNQNIISLKSYISGITRNLIYEKLKKNKVTYDLSQFENIVFIDNNFYIEERERIEKIEKTVSTFKPIDSQIIKLFYYEDKSTKEIAKILNLSEVNVRKKLSRLRKKIRKEIDKGGTYGRK